MKEIYTIEKKKNPILKGKNFKDYISKMKFDYSRSYIYFLIDLYSFVKVNPKFGYLKGFNLTEIKNNFHVIKEFAKDERCAYLFGSVPNDPNQDKSRNQRRKLPLNTE